jgi:hypothetical protein
VHRPQAGNRGCSKEAARQRARAPAAASQNLMLIPRLPALGGHSGEGGVTPSKSRPAERQKPMLQVGQQDPDPLRSGTGSGYFSKRQWVWGRGRAGAP